MDWIGINDLYDIVEISHNNVVHDNVDNILIIAKYNEAKIILDYLVKLNHPIYFAEFWYEDWNNYNKEYYIHLDQEGISISPAFRYKSDGYNDDSYLITCSNKAYLFDNCSSKIIKYLECDEIFEIGFDDKTNENIDSIENTYNSISQIVERDQMGNATGFTKTWINHTENNQAYYSFRYENSNLSELHDIAELFGIKL